MFNFFYWSLLIFECVHALEPIGCIYPVSMPDPLQAHRDMVFTLSMGAISRNLETPIVIHIAHASSTCDWNCVAYHDVLSKNTLTGESPQIKADAQLYHNSWSRFLCNLQCATIMSNALGLEGVLDPLLGAWGVREQIVNRVPDTLLLCNGDIACIDGYVGSRMATPFVIGQVVGDEVVRHFKADGFNSEGDRRFDSITEQEVECTSNCPRYTDTTGYQPKNVARTRVIGDKYNLNSVDKKWQPLQESDNRGYFTRQEHVVPHIGFKVTPDALSLFKEASDPAYDYRIAALQVVEELRLTAGSPFRKAMIDFFDNKLQVRGLIENAIKFSFVTEQTYERQMAFTHGISTAEFDALLQVWRAKVQYDLVRPTTVIQRWGDDELYTFDGNRSSTEPTTIMARDFQPYIRVMPHSEFPSGSACLCTSYQEFSDLFATQYYATPTIPNLSIPETTLAFSDMTELAQTCGQSRIWGGMHFAQSVPAAFELCSDIGNAAMERLNVLMNGNTFASSSSDNFIIGNQRPTCNPSP